MSCLFGNSIIFNNGISVSWVGKLSDKYFVSFTSSKTSLQGYLVMESISPDKARDNRHAFSICLGLRRSQFQSLTGIVLALLCCSSMSLICISILRVLKVLQQQRRIEILPRQSNYQPFYVISSRVCVHYIIWLGLNNSRYILLTVE